MAGGTKAEFPPLLPDGLHRMSFAELMGMCVASFPLSTRRKPLARSLESLLTGLSGASVSAEVWINGSFLTHKIDPDDVDLVVVVQALPADQAAKDVLTQVARQEFKNPMKCDSYLNIEYPAGHPHYALGQQQRVYWLKQFGESRSGEKKGIALLDIPVK